MSDTLIKKEPLNLRKVLKENTMLLVLAAVMILFEIFIRATDNGSLFVPANVNNIILQNSYVLILAAGMLLCILTGGNIDLSVGSVICLVGAIAATLIVNLHCNIYLSILISLVIGTAIGAWHGAFIAYLHIPPFITTLSGMLLWRGVALIVLDGMTISPLPQKYLNLFSSYIPEVFLPDLTTKALSDTAAKAQLQGITLKVTMIVAILICLAMIFFQIVSRKRKEHKGYSVPARGAFVARLVIITAAVLVVSWLLGHHHGIPTVLVLLAVVIACYTYYTQNTVPGRYLYAIGGNVKAAKLSGVNTDNVMMFAYTNMGFLSAVAALVCIARFNSAAPTAGQSYEMDAIGSCFIGGASAYGGTGTVGGAVIGAIFMGVLNNGMSILGVDSNWQQAVKGFVLLLAVIFDVVSKQRKSR